MRDIERIDKICDQLKIIWKKVPDWRFMQMMNNLIADQHSDCYYMEEGKFLTALDALVSRWQQEDTDDTEATQN